MHGIADDVAAVQGQEHLERGFFSGPPEALDALIGYGQGGDPKTGDTRDRFTARQRTVERIRDRLTAGGMTTLLTRKDAGNFRGRDEKRLNQWFNRLGYGFDAVESIQLEIKERGFRDSRENAERAAGIIAGALAGIHPSE